VQSHQECIEEEQRQLREIEPIYLHIAASVTEAPFQNIPGSKGRSPIVRWRFRGADTAAFGGRSAHHQVVHLAKNFVQQGKRRFDDVVDEACAAKRRHRTPQVWRAFLNFLIKYCVIFAQSGQTLVPARANPVSSRSDWLGRNASASQRHDCLDAEH